MVAWSSLRLYVDVEASSGPVYIVGDSTTAFLHDHLEEHRGNLWHMMQKDHFQNPQLWEDVGAKLLSSSGAKLLRIASQIEKVPDGADVLIVGGWNSRHPRDAESLAADCEHIRDALQGKRVARVSCAEGRCDLSKNLESRLRQLLPEVPIIEDFPRLYGGLEGLSYYWWDEWSMKWALEYCDNSHRCWTVQSAGALLDAFHCVASAV